MSDTQTRVYVPSTLVLEPPTTQSSPLTGATLPASSLTAARCAECFVDIQVESVRIETYDVLFTVAGAIITQPRLADYYTLNTYGVTAEVPLQTACMLSTSSGTVTQGLSVTIPAEKPSNFYAMVGSSFLTQLQLTSCNGNIAPTILLREQIPSQVVGLVDSWGTTALPAGPVGTTVWLRTTDPPSVPQATIFSAGSGGDNGLSVGARVGIGLGVSAFCVVAIVAGILLVVRRRRQHRAREHSNDEHSQIIFAQKPELHGATREIRQLDSRSLMEMYGAGRPPELETVHRFELDGGFRGRELRGEEAAHEKG